MGTSRTGWAATAVVVAVMAAAWSGPGVAEAYMGKGGNAKMTLSLTKDYTPSPWTKEMGWGARAKAKLCFGVKNTLLGWTEFFTEPKRAMDQGDNFFMGVGMGLKNGVEDTVGGVVHIVTSPLTDLDAPLPKGGVQLLNS